MFHDLDIGCYLAWEGYPRWRMFEDARLPAYPDEFHHTMDHTPLDPSAFDVVLRRFGPSLTRSRGSEAHVPNELDRLALVWV